MRDNSSQDDSCQVEVPVPKNAQRAEIEEAIKQALEAKWKDLSKCKTEIVINVKFPH